MLAVRKFFPPRPGVSKSCPAAHHRYTWDEVQQGIEAAARRADCVSILKHLQWADPAAYERIAESVAELSDLQRLQELAEAVEAIRYAAPSYYPELAARLKTLKTIHGVA